MLLLDIILKTTLLISILPHSFDLALAPKLQSILPTNPNKGMHLKSCSFLGHRPALISPKDNQGFHTPPLELLSNKLLYFNSLSSFVEAGSPSDTQGIYLINVNLTQLQQRCRDTVSTLFLCHLLEVCSPLMSADRWGETK